MIATSPATAPVAPPDHRRLAVPDPLGHEPADQRARGAEVRREERRGREPVGPEGAPGVEAEPPEPEDPGAQDHHRDVVRREVPPRVAAAFPDEQGGGQGGRTRADVDDGAAGEVERAEPVGPEEPAAPDPMGQGRVHEERPECDERDVAAEPHALGERPRDQGRRDHGEHQLERGERRVRHGRRQRVWCRPDTAEPQVREASDHATDVRAEREGVPGKQPHDRDDRDRGDGLHHRAEHVLRPDQAAVEQRQPRCHEQDEGRGAQHPRRVTGVRRDPWPHPDPHPSRMGPLWGMRRRDR